MDNVRVGIVGLYGIANRHYDEISSTAELELGAVCDVNGTLASTWSEEYEVPWYQDYHDLFDSDDCDLVIILTPHGLHCEMACAAMEAGKPVIIQKPMCITVGEADRIIETAKRTGTKVGTFHTAHTSQWDALQVIRSGALGDLMRVSYSWHASRGMAYYNSGPWRGTWKQEGSGVLSNQCIHDINRLHALAGPVAEVTSCTLANMRHPGTEVEPTLPSLLQFALSVTEGWPIQAPPEFALPDIETWNAMVLSHFKHEPVQIPVDRDEYAALHADLVAGKHGLHWS